MMKQTRSPVPPGPVPPGLVPPGPVPPGPNPPGPVPPGPVPPGPVPPVLVPPGPIRPHPISQLSACHPVPVRRILSRCPCVARSPDAVSRPVSRHGAPSSCIDAISQAREFAPWVCARDAILMSQGRAAPWNPLMDSESEQ